VTRPVRMAILACLWLVPLLLFALAFRFGWHAVWSSVGIPALSLPFGDLRSITGALVIVKQHGDPLVANPGDPWGRPMNYPRLWMGLFSAFGINSGNVIFVGILFCIFYLGCVSWLILLCRRDLDAAILLVAALSLAPLSGIQVGNGDLLIFGLVFLGAVAGSSKLRSGAFGAGALLKIYPLAAMAIHALQVSLERRPLRRKLVSILPLALVLCCLAWQWRDLGAVRKATPVSNRMAYGTLSMKAQMDEELGPALGRSMAASYAMVAACWLTGLLASVAAWNAPSRLGRSHASSMEARLFSAFGAVYVFSFAIGSNFDYRLIFLLPTLPLAFELARDSASRKWAVLYIAAVLLAENPLDLRQIHGSTISHLTTFFVFLVVLSVLASNPNGCSSHPWPAPSRDRDWRRLAGY
jgi:hypothetical protein